MPPVGLPVIQDRPLRTVRIRDERLRCEDLVQANLPSAIGEAGACHGCGRDSKRSDNGDGRRREGASTAWCLTDDTLQAVHNIRLVGFWVVLRRADLLSAPDCGAESHLFLVRREFQHYPGKSDFHCRTNTGSARHAASQYQRRKWPAVLGHQQEQACGLPRQRDD